MTLVSRWWAVWRETQLDETLLLTSSGTSGPLSRTSKYYFKEKTTFFKDISSYGNSASSFPGIMRKAMEDRNTDFHLAEASHIVFQIAFPPLLSFFFFFFFCLSGFFALNSPALHVAPVLNSPHWQNCLDRPRSNLCQVSAQASETASAGWSSEWQAVTQVILKPTRFGFQSWTKAWQDRGAYIHCLTACDL